MARRSKKTQEQLDAERERMFAAARRKLAIEADDKRWDGLLVEVVTRYEEDGAKMIKIEVVPVVAMPTCQDGCGR